MDIDRLIVYVLGKQAGIIRKAEVLADMRGVADDDERLLRSLNFRIEQVPEA
ncbi:hypothetical protein PGT21_015259 [Puccinia graminis f. sp. tritici]|uniref:Uncharacterized protein n=1 Tax=Puccinia graminis f. sp. tritici TaxID=56615 RepID=A0A5B0LUG9_PUCGR|nr:hypothetical protein PGT21_015259 [Puccinia graminis f. sp. tritici]